MNKIGMVAFYFGKLPNYFSLWLKSAELNVNIDFLLFIDDKSYQSYPQNVYVHYTSFVEIVEKTSSLFDFPINLTRPYKFCDYRPAFGYIFERELKGYDYWGTVDLDIIMGNINKFITNEILEKYDRILTRDHFTIYRNSLEINRRFMSPSQFYGLNYKIVFSSPKIFAFGERKDYGVYHIWKQNGWEMYDEPIVADINYKYYRFKVNDCRGFERTQSNKQIFVWNSLSNNGILTQYSEKNGKVFKKEFMYIHLQKREIKLFVYKDLNAYIISPRGIFMYAIENIDSKIINSYMEKNAWIREIQHYLSRVKIKFKKKLISTLGNLEK